MQPTRADHGEIRPPGLVGRWLGARPRIVREANYIAARECLPANATIVQTDPESRWIVFELPNGTQQIRFLALEAWLSNEPTPAPNNTIVTSATIHADGRVVEIEGMHRTRAVARDRVLLTSAQGGVPDAPGWLDFAFDPTALRDTPSSRALAEMLGGAVDSPLVPAR